MKTVIMYKVCVPSMFAWPVTNVTIKVFFTKKAAEDFIDNYPNPFLKPLLTIYPEDVFDAPETD